MDGKVVVVTGALGALGKVVAEQAQAGGARVAGIDQAPSQAQATPHGIEIGGVDLSDAAQAKKAIDAAAAHFGKLDALINIAGGFAFEAVADGDSKTWQRMYALNVLTALNADELIGLLGTFSWVILMEDEARDRLFDTARRVLRDALGVSGDVTVDIGYRAEVFKSRRHG